MDGGMPRGGLMPGIVSVLRTPGVQSPATPEGRLSGWNRALVVMIGAFGWLSLLRVREHLPELCGVTQHGTHDLFKCTIGL